jgi:branched-chain amino acid transport system ATP-binding protein
VTGERGTPDGLGDPLEPGIEEALAEPPPIEPDAAEADLILASAVAPEAAANAPILAAHNVTKRFGGLIAVNDVSFSIPDGAIVSLIGPNGAGKTTFFNIIAGIYDPTSGRIAIRERTMVARPIRAWLEPVLWVTPAFFVGIISAIVVAAAASETVAFLGATVTLVSLILMLLAAIARPEWYHRLLIRLGIFRSARPNDMVRAGIGRTFQNIRLFQNMTAEENVLVGMHIKLKANLLDAMFSTPRNRREEISARIRANELLNLVGLKGIGGELAKNLPYGDQRRLEVARALGSDPALLLLDEPTAGMNPNETADMMSLINKLRTDLGLTVLLIEHDMKVVMGISDRVTVLDHGERIAEGTPDEVRRNPRVIEAYLGTPAT